MSEIIKSLGLGQFDSYTWYARVTPVFTVLLPLGIGAAVWFPGEDITAKIGTTTLAPFALAALAAQFGRRWGKEKEKSLWHSWGGAPTTQFLRHKDMTFNPVIRKRYHKKLQELLPDYDLPTPETEKQNPQAADQVYEACTRYLIDQTRDKQRFPLVYKENVYYGFLRNLWGMKSLGIALALLGMTICGGRAWAIWGKPESISFELVAGGCLCLLLCVLWMFWVSPSSVRIAANAYAERLLETCDQLDKE